MIRTSQKAYICSTQWSAFLFLVLKTKIDGLIDQEIFRRVADTYREEKKTTQGNTRNIAKTKNTNKPFIVLTVQRVLWKRLDSVDTVLASPFCSLSLNSTVIHQSLSSSLGLHWKKACIISHITITAYKSVY